MNEEWWYEINNQQLGSVATDELRSLRQAGKISETTLVWQRNFDNRRPLAEAIPAATAVGPPPLPQSESTATPAQSVLSPASPIKRFFARRLDMLFSGFPLAAAIFKLSAWAINYKRGNQSVGLVYFFLTIMVISALQLIIEGFIFSIFRTTPGKFLLGIHVRDSDGQKITRMAYFRRLSRLFFHGLGLGIFSMITMPMQYLWVADGRPTSYDEGKFTVFATTKLADWRVMIASILFLGFLPVYLVLTLGVLMFYIWPS